MRINIKVLFDCHGLVKYLVLIADSDGLGLVYDAVSTRGGLADVGQDVYQ
jgi:hypothetical protein